MQLNHKVKQIPKSPGVYFFLNKKNEIIYIGKAKILRNRVLSYFNNTDSKDVMTKVMVETIFNLEWLVTNSEV